MTAPTRGSTVIFNASVSPGNNKAQGIAVANALPNFGWTDVRAFNGGRVGILITNGSSGPGSALAFTLQMSDTQDASNPIDIWSGGATTIANDVTSVSAPFPAEASYIRVVPFANTSNPVSLKATAFTKA